MAPTPFCATSCKGNARPWVERGQRGRASAPLPGALALAGSPSLPPLPIARACCAPVFRSPSCPSRHHCDWVLHRGTAKFICCQALYILHNSVSQALLCMCLIFTIKKTNGESDSPDTLEGWAPALPRRNLGMNSISDLRLYFMHNTPVVFKSP